MDTIFQSPRTECSMQKRVYISIDHEHGRLYKLLVEEQFMKRLPYRFVFSPDFEGCSSQKERAEQVQRMQEAVKESDLFLVICTYDSNRIMPHCRPFGNINWQNLEIGEAEKYDLPIILVKTQQTGGVPVQLEGVSCLETRRFDLRSISRLLEEAIKYWKL